MIKDYRCNSLTFLILATSMEHALEPEWDRYRNMLQSLLHLISNSATCPDLLFP
jgi:hypothetical protein